MFRIRKLDGVAATVVALALIAVSAVADEPAADQAAAMAFLDWESGNWDAEITVFAPGAEPQTFAGEQTDRMGACGLWLITELRMKAPDGGDKPPYEGHGVLGFDPELSQLVGVWVDSKTTWLATAEGKVDGEKLTLEVEGRHPVNGSKMMRRFVTTRVGQDERRLEIFIPGPTGEDMRVAQIDYTRRESTSAK